MIIKASLVNTVVTFRLVTGETVVGKLLNNTPTEIKVSKPISITLFEQGGEIGLRPSPFLFTSEDTEVTFPVTALLFLPVSATEMISQRYIQDTTGLVTAPPQGIVGI